MIESFQVGAIEFIVYGVIDDFDHDVERRLGPEGG
jgi:hypothetical protein